MRPRLRTESLVPEPYRAPSHSSGEPSRPPSEPVSWTFRDDADRRVTTVHRTWFGARALAAALLGTTPEHVENAPSEGRS